jgi:hypothetical protein
MKNEYDLDSAVTFFLVGLGMGSFLALAMVFNPKQQRFRLERRKEVRNWRGGGLQGQEHAEQRVA